MAKLNIWHFNVGHWNADNTWSNSPDSAGGVSVRLWFTNNTEKTIKYATFMVTPLNAVDDVVSCDVSGKTEVSLKFTGPLKPKLMYRNASWGQVWYNHSITAAFMSSVYLEYMDGTSEKLSADDIDCSPPKGVINAGACYVATAVYGSYDCPQVWTLRRYRDDTLAKTWYGRAFIRTYYTISPILVKWFGSAQWFKKMWQGKLDRMVKNLQDSGVEATPYTDKKW